MPLDYVVTNKTRLALEEKIDFLLIWTAGTTIMCLPFLC